MAFEEMLLVDCDVAVVREGNRLSIVSQLARGGGVDVDVLREG